VATASDDQSARVWDAATGEPVIPMLRHATSVHRAFFTPDGRRLLTTSTDGMVRVWALIMASQTPTEELLLAQFLAGRQVDDTVLPMTPAIMQAAWHKLKSSHFSPGTEQRPELVVRALESDYGHVLRTDAKRRIVEQGLRNVANSNFTALKGA